MSFSIELLLESKLNEIPAMMKLTARFSFISANQDVTLHN